MNFFIELSRNKALTIAVTSWLTAQVLKLIINILTDKKIDFKRLVGAGGMPSSHTSFVVALTTTIGLQHGWGSTYFALSLVFSLIIMYDAAGVRRAAGRQAAVLNKIVEEYHDNRIIKEERLKELIGHTPVEVFAGALLGIIIANILY